MDQKLEFLPTPLPQLGKVLEQLFEGSSPETGIRHPAQRSMILLTPPGTDWAKIESVISELSIMHPSRFFLVQLEAPAGASEQDDLNIRCEVAGRCHWISGTHKVCCDIVKLVASTQAIKAITSVIRTNVHTGMPIELYLVGQPRVDAAAQSLFPLVDQIYYDLRGFSGCLTEFGPVLASKVAVTDFQWVALGPWREQVKLAFERLPLRRSLQHLEGLNLVIAGQAARGGSAPLQSAIGRLLSGWFLDRLGLELRSATASGFKCRTESGKDIELKLQAAPGGEIPAISEVSIQFGAGAEVRQVLFRRGGSESERVLETIVEGSLGFKMTRALDETTLSELYRKYFLVGESVSNYRAALERGIAMCQLVNKSVKSVKSGE
jgi:hypothetical protein